MSAPTTVEEAANHFTEREWAVLYAISEGMQDKEIADRLFVSIKTVQFHISNIRSKLGGNLSPRMLAIRADRLVNRDHRAKDTAAMTTIREAAELLRRHGD